MDIVIHKRAMNSMERVAEFVESRNTPGSGSRWLDKLKSEINSLATNKTKLAICKHASLAKLNYRCMVHDKWVMAYRISARKMEVCRFIWGPNLA